MIFIKSSEAGAPPAIFGVPQMGGVPPRLGTAALEFFNSTDSKLACLQEVSNNKITPDMRPLCVGIFKCKQFFDII